MPDLFGELSPDEVALQREQEQHRASLVDAQEREEFAARMENLVQLLQAIVEPKPSQIEKIHMSVVKELGLGYIKPEEVESILIELNIAEESFFIGLVSFGRIVMMQIINRMLLSRSINGKFMDNLMINRIQKELYTNPQQQPASWVGFR